MQELISQLVQPYQILIFLFSYALGSVPVGLFVGFFFKKGDIRKHGSGNIGAANVARNFGFKLGLLVLVLDMFKGYCAIAVAQSFEASYEVASLAGFFAVLGHCYPIWLRFVGGKGVATGFGVLLGISCWLSLVGACIFLVVMSLVRITSAASLTACFSVVLTSFVLPLTAFERVVICMIVGLIIIRHRANIARLFRGEEPRL